MYFKQDGSLAIGQVRADGGYLKYFDENGIQYKGKAVKVGSRYKYYDENDGQPVTNRFAQIEPNVWAYFGADGYAVTGEQVINGQHLYFDQSGRQVKGAYVTVNG